MKQAIMKHEAKITEDLPGKTIVVTRAFDAPLEKVWRAFTEREILDQWWAPKPFKMETQSQEFKPGGIWHFSMINPNGDRYWWRVNYDAIDPQRSITSSGGACDENAKLNEGAPPMRRLTEFAATPTGTLVTITIKFENEAHLKTMVEKGMLTGTTMVFNNLDELLETSL
jgi:uncharacterized protein YndB with AHSA1/START domain